MRQNRKKKKKFPYLFFFFFSLDSELKILNCNFSTFFFPPTPVSSLNMVSGIFFVRL